MNVSKKFVARTYFALLSGIHARDTLGPPARIVTLQPIADLGVSAEYSIISRLSAFAELDNLLNDKYQRWYGYQAYGLNIYGGLRLKF